MYRCPHLQSSYLASSSPGMQMAVLVQPSPLNRQIRAVPSHEPVANMLQKTKLFLGDVKGFDSY